MLAMRCRSDACVRAVAVRKERGALPAIPTATPSTIPVHVHVQAFDLGGYMVAVSGWN